MIDISIPHRKTKGAQPAKTHRAIEEGRHITETLCGIEITTDKRGFFVSAKSRRSIKVKTSGSVTDFDCVNCRSTWHRITSDG